ncbi:MAG: cell division protein FtsH [bacterium]|nr:cell division protein FtsH [bacterium]
MKDDDAKTPNDAANDRPDSQLVATAYHEAGHAVMAVSLGRVIQKVTIAPGKSQFGQAHLGITAMGKGRTKASKDLLEDEALILLAGMVAEAHFTGHYCRHGAGQDLRYLQRLLRDRAGSESQLERLQRRLLDKTEHLLREKHHAKAIELIAQELIQRTTISGRAVRHFFQYAEQQSKD